MNKTIRKGAITTLITWITERLMEYSAYIINAVHPPEYVDPQTGTVWGERYDAVVELEWREDHMAVVVETDNKTLRYKMNLPLFCCELDDFSFILQPNEENEMEVFFLNDTTGTGYQVVDHPIKNLEQMEIGLSVKRTQNISGLFLTEKRKALRSLISALINKNVVVLVKMKESRWISKY